MNQWKKGKIIYTCTKCNKEIAKEQAEIKDEYEVNVDCLCFKCKKE